ncbi:MAG: hypothetical protein F4Y56_10455 [Acidimicrobiaceae bacterium]|nr:hypothetical protein [Acidimicrobiaceae bacterium]
MFGVVGLGGWGGLFFGLFACVLWGVPVTVAKPAQCLSGLPVGGLGRGGLGRRGLGLVEPAHGRGGVVLGPFGLPEGSFVGLLLAVGDQIGVEQRQGGRGLVVEGPVLRGLGHTVRHLVQVRQSNLEPARPRWHTVLAVRTTVSP